MARKGIANALLMVLADGMGAAAGGATASRIVVETFASEFPRSNGPAGIRFRECLKAATARLREREIEHPRLSGMGNDRGRGTLRRAWHRLAERRRYADVAVCQRRARAAECGSFDGAGPGAARPDRESCRRRPRPGTGGTICCARRSPPFRRKWSIAGLVPAASNRVTIC